MNSPDLSIILVSYNTAAYIRRAIESVLQETRLTHYEIIVVDNASSDDSVAMIRTHFPQVHLIAAPDNSGFAGGVQQGAAVARGKYLLLLNPDTVIETWLYLAKELNK